MWFGAAALAMVVLLGPIIRVLDPSSAGAPPAEQGGSARASDGGITVSAADFDLCAFGVVEVTSNTASGPQAVDIELAVRRPGGEVWDSIDAYFELSGRFGGLLEFSSFPNVNYAVAQDAAQGRWSCTIERLDVTPR